LRAPDIARRKARRVVPPALYARLGSQVSLETHANGDVVASFDGYSVGLGTFGAGVADRAKDLRKGLRLASFAGRTRSIDKETDRLVRRLARHGLLEYCVRHAGRGENLVVIEPQVADYWPGTPKLDNADALILSRFAYIRRRGQEIVLESPRADALFKIRDPKIAAAVALLSVPQQVKQLRRNDGFPGLELLALLVDSRILFKIDAATDRGLRAAEGGDGLVLWDFHDLLFHTRSTTGRHANPVGGLYTYAGIVPPLPAVRPPWPGKKIDLRNAAGAHSHTISPISKLLRERHSTRSYDHLRPISVTELSRFLDYTARVLSTWESGIDLGDAGPVLSYAARPYPSAGASYELELYLSVDNCEGLARGFYHYDAAEHALVPIGVRTHEFEALLKEAELAMDAPAPPQILITIAARFARMTWKYSSIAYALILKDVGALIQTFYVMATDMGLGGCAIGSTNIDLFAKMTGIEFHVEGPVGQFAIGRATKPTPSE
jgi:SagB-type dehydrogenase family enzyme